MATIVNDRIDVRISKEQKELIKFASELKGFKNLTEFVVFCISNEANRIILENNLILKSFEDKKVFIDALLNPPKPNSKLKNAQLNYLKFVESNGVENSSS
ncbi:DUF1778 domain-containing protein [Flavobacterium sp. JP2137]|uniref:type II toxin-antitoxin system TacA family antitoxin n=1 Tax=Flavobacterium sp. JP2137 TaxID=3414510 RepID=UPI003D2FB2ED